MAPKPRGGKGGAGSGSSSAPSQQLRTAANTPTYVYMDTFNKSAVCDDDRRAVELACKTKTPQQKEKDRNKKHGLLSVVRGALQRADAVGQKVYGYKRGDPPGNEWMDDHCDGMWLKPRLNGTEEFQKELAEFKQGLETAGASIDSYLQHPDKLVKATYESLLREAQEQLGADELRNMWFKHQLKSIGTAAIPTPTKGGKLLTLVPRLAKLGFAASSYMDGIEMLSKVLTSPDALSQIQNLKFLLEGAQERFGAALQQWKERPDIAMSELMSVQGEFDPCLRARKCMLVPYEVNEKKPLGKLDKLTGKRAAQKQSTVGYVDSGKGCCPGQTGHHIIPDAAAKDAKCQGYVYKEAPTICLEGQDNHFGSHGRAHGKLEQSIQDYKDRTGKDTMPYDKMRDQALAAVADSTQQCNPECLKAQLDSYYKCGEMPAKSGKSESKKPQQPATPATGSDHGHDAPCTD